MTSRAVDGKPLQSPVDLSLWHLSVVLDRPGPDILSARADFLPGLKYHLNVWRGRLCGVKIMGYEYIQEATMNPTPRL
jgi:hypothetical protein